MQFFFILIEFKFKDYSELYTNVDLFRIFLTTDLLGLMTNSDTISFSPIFD